MIKSLILLALISLATSLCNIETNFDYPSTHIKAHIGIDCVYNADKLDNTCFKDKATY
jgi:hypothetical protein